MPTFSSGPDRDHSEAPLQRVSISLAAAVPLTILALVVSFADIGGAALAAWVVVLALGSGLALAGLGRGAGRDEAASERAARSRARLEARVEARPSCGSGTKRPARRRSCVSIGSILASA